MPKFQFTNKAKEDLSDIWNFTFDTWSENQADKYYQEILDKCDEISENPNDGKRYEGVWNSVKGISVNKHIIFYKEISSELIEIVRILHQRMDLKSRLKI